MINPWKSYRMSQTGVITNIENHWGQIDKFIVSYGQSGKYEGYVSDIPNFKRFKVGDEVKCRAQFSITLDKFLIKGMRRVIKK